MARKIGLASTVVVMALGAGLSLAAGHGDMGSSSMGHQRRATAPTTAPATQRAKVYTCSMHPEVTSDKPGKCPKCGMNLRLKQDKDDPNQGGKGHDGAHGHSH